MSAAAGSSSACAVTAAATTAAAAPRLTSMRELALRVLGAPAPQGSKRHVGNGRMVEMSKNLPAWRKAVETAAANAIRANYPWIKMDGPLELAVVFFLPKPKRPMNDEYPVGPPDGSKLLRAVEDCLVRAGVVHDDARFVHWEIDKLWASAEHPAGCRLRVRERAAVLL